MASAPISGKIPRLARMHDMACIKLESTSLEGGVAPFCSLWPFLEHQGGETRGIPLWIQCDKPPPEGTAASREACNWAPTCTDSRWGKGFEPGVLGGFPFGFREANTWRFWPLRSFFVVQYVPDILSLFFSRWMRGFCAHGRG